MKALSKIQCIVVIQIPFRALTQCQACGIEKQELSDALSQAQNQNSEGAFHPDYPPLPRTRFCYEEV